MKIVIKNLSESIQNELKRAYNTYGTGTDYSDDERESTTLKLKSKYSGADKASRGDVLVPYEKDAWSCVNLNRGRYYIDYKWPEDGFTADISFPSSLKIGTEIDRLGGTGGGYVCPCTDRTYTVCERAIPYYFLETTLEEEPSYHRYKVVKEITFSAILEALNNISSTVINDGAKRIIINTLIMNRNGWLKFGTVAKVDDFGSQGIGGGKQYYSVVSVKTLIDLGFIEEIKVKEAIL